MVERIVVTVLSIVVPAYNEAEVINHTLNNIALEASRITDSFELMVVNDGSSDSTESVVLGLMTVIPQLRLINLSKNYGHSEALIVGLSQSTGSYVITMDADMQHPPRLIPDLFNTIKNDSSLDVVQCLRINRETDSLFKRTAAKIFYWAINKLTDLQVTPNASDFRIMNARSVQLINSLTEKQKIIRLLIPLFKFNTKIICFEDEKRYAGSSKYTWGKMINFGVSSVISFSAKPLFLMALVGFISSVVLCFFALSTFLIWIFVKTIPGWTSIVLFILTSNAVILSCLGILGLYIGRIYESELNRPSAIWSEQFKNNETLE